MGNDRETVESRVPPHDLQAEAAVLSVVMVDPDGLGKVAFLRPEHFYSEAHRRIFEACGELAASGQRVDNVLVTTWLKDHDRLAQVGGAGYVTEVLNGAPTVVNVESYGRIVHGKWRARCVILACQKWSAMGYARIESAVDYAASAAQELSEIATVDASRSFESVAVILRENFRKIGEAKRSGRKLLGLATGYDRFDRMTSGLHDGELTIVAARPGMGKTSLALNMAINITVGCTTEQQPEASEVGVFSLEMPREQLVNRMVCSEARVPFSRIRAGMETPADWQKLTAAASVVDRLPIWIDDSATLDPIELRAKAQRLANEARSRKRRLALIVVDYLQLMRGRTDYDSREQEVASVSRALKAIAKELSIPVLALSQLNRKLEGRGDKRPQLSDLRESGAIEQDADSVVFIHREEFFNKNADRYIAELIVAKQRNGPTDTVKVRWDGESTRFDNLADGEFEGEEETSRQRPTRRTWHDRDEAS